MNVKAKTTVFIILTISLLVFSFTWSPAIVPYENNIYNQEIVSSLLSQYGLQEFSAETFAGNMKIVTFTSPDSSYPVLLDLINSAQSTIKIEIYSLYNPYLLAALGKAESRGVDVTVLTEKYHASPFENSYNTWGAYNLTSAGADVFWTNKSEFTYTHSKFAVIDDSITIVMSGNWVKTGVPVNNSYGNREWGVVIYNTQVANFFSNVFANDLLVATPYTESADGTGKSSSDNIPKGKYPHPFTNATFIGNFEVTTVLSPDTSETMIKKLIDSANQTLEIAQLYIYGNWSTGVSPFVESIVAAAQRGVHVKIILNNGSSPNEDLINYLKSYDNIAVALSNDTYFESYHVKGVIVDGKIVLVASINWSENSVKNNREAGVIIRGEPIADYFYDVFSWDWNTSQIVFSNINETETPGTGGTTPSEGESPLTTTEILYAVGIIVVAVVIFVVKSTVLGKKTTTKRRRRKKK